MVNYFDEQKSVYGQPATSSKKEIKASSIEPIKQEYSTSALKNFPAAFKKTLEKFRELPGVKQLREFTTPKDKEEAIRMGLIPIGNGKYLDATSGVGSIKNVGAKATKGLISGLFSKLNVGKVSPIKTEVKSLLKQGIGNKAAQKIDSDFFISSIKANYTKAERELVPFVIEGDKYAVKNASPRVKQLAKEVKNYFDEGYDFLKNNFDDVSYRENYVTHLWDIPKKKSGTGAKFFSTQNPFTTKQRTYTTLREGMKAGLKPKTTDIAEILSVYDDYKINTVENKKIVDVLKKITDDSGEKIIKRVDKAPDDWVTIDHPALNRGMAKKGEDVLFVSKVPVKVHPEIAKELNSIFGKRFSGGTAKALTVVNSFVKKAALSMSGFHHFALTESAIASGLKKELLSLWNPKNIYNALKKGEYDVFKNIEASKDAVRHGLQLGSLSDAQVGIVRSTLMALENKTKNIPGVNKLTSGIRGFNDLWDKALWDYYHNSLKIHSYENWLGQELKRLPDTASPQEIKSVKEEVAQLVNDTFGGQVWENFFVHPKAQQISQWILLSPDWTMSTLRQAGAPLGLGTVSGKAGVRAKQGAAFWARAALYVYGGANVLNYVNSKKDDGEGKWLWENDKGYQDKIYLGRGEDGKKIYARPGKQFREIYEWLENPVKKFAGKMSPALNEVYSQISGTTTTGWDEEWKGKDFWDSDALEARAKSFLELGVPYVIPSMAQGKNATGFVMPLSKANFTTTKNEFIKALENNDKDAGMQIYMQALDNNIDAKTALDSAKQEVKYKKKMTRADAEKIVDDVLKLPSNERKQRVKDLIEDGTINETTAGQIKSTLESKKRVLDEKKLFEKLKK